MYEEIIGGGEKEGIVITDRKIKEQKTNFEFFATQKELNIPIQIVDMEDIVEKNNELFVVNDLKSPKLSKINRLYNRILQSEALFEDNYPEDAEKWHFRFDTHYKSFKFINFGFCPSCL